jgi:hypothetical protein
MAKDLITLIAVKITPIKNAPEADTGNPAIGNTIKLAA